MKIAQYQYDFPEQCVAKYPPKVRGNSKLFVVYTQTGEIKITKYHELYKFLNEGDLVIRNTTKVVKSRLLPKYCKEGSNLTETNIEIFLLPSEDSDYDLYIASAYEQRYGAFKLKALIRGKRQKLSRIEEFVFQNKWHAKVLEEVDNAYNVLLWHESWETNDVSSVDKVKAFYAFVDKEGHVPIPPYLKRQDEQSDVTRYQTIFADQRGSVAAPTASLNFTEGLEDHIKKNNVVLGDIVLHVGLGTFAPLRFEDIEKNKLHHEVYFVSEETQQKLKRAKAEHKRILAIGTTALRTLETIAPELETSQKNIFGATELFIYPPYEFKLVNTLLTNFHYPQTSLIVLVDAFLQYKKSKVSWKEIYTTAIQNNAKLFSYGDSMLIL